MQGQVGDVDPTGTPDPPRAARGRLDPVRERLLTEFGGGLDAAARPRRLSPRPPLRATGSGVSPPRRRSSAAWGTCIPGHRHVEAGVALQAWLVTQVVAHQFGWLPAERARQLEALGLDWAEMARWIRGRAQRTRE